MYGARRFVVEHVRRKLPPTREICVDKPPIGVSKISYSGSIEQCIRVTFTDNLTHGQRDYLEEHLRAHECYEDVYEIRWPAQNTMVIEIKNQAMRSSTCPRVDVENTVRSITTHTPTNLR